ncbi:hypothetical protein [Lentilitoribacter sp. EG35]|uniref:hypothetical protein n=1 Tax=Lentilitoribacter sp. EG35 TaxID=3234192 RepID=UPI003460FB56
MNSQAFKVDAEYAKAVSHSRLVAFLRKFLPIGSGVIIVFFIGLSIIRTSLPDGLVIESAGLEDGKLVMRSPVLVGQTSTDLPYKMSAKRAIQAIGQTSLITLEDIAAQVPLNSENDSFIEAAQGVFDQEKEFLTFTQPFIVTTTSGLEAKFINGEYNVATGAFESKNPINVKFDGGWLTSNTMQITEGGETLKFDGDVRMKIEPRMLKKEE